MERVIDTREGEGGARSSVEGKGAQETARRSTPWIGLFYAITIVFFFCCRSRTVSSNWLRKLQAAAHS
jgi:hypothetical protein